MLAAAVWRGAFGKRTKGRLLLSLLPVLMIAAYAAYLFFYDLARRDCALLNPQLTQTGNGYMGSVMQNIMFGIPAPEIEPIDTTWLFV